MYVKLVFRNAKRSVKDYLVYIVTMTICVTLFYSFLSISSSYYHPDIGSEYNFTMLSGGMKMAICAITLILLFLIKFVNNYMLRRRQKEFALESVMGMEQKNIALLFFGETFIMGLISIAAGVFPRYILLPVYNGNAGNVLWKALSTYMDTVPGYSDVYNRLFCFMFSCNGAVQHAYHPKDQNHRYAQGRPGKRTGA